MYYHLLSVIDLWSISFLLLVLFVVCSFNKQFFIIVNEKIEQMTGYWIAECSITKIIIQCRWVSNTFLLSVKYH
jgi:hypothetical protein